MTEPKKDSKGASMSLRLPEKLKQELDDAAWIEGRHTTDIVLEGIELALQPIRSKHGGKVPTRQDVLAALKGKKK